MSEVYIISDTHFNHGKILEFKDQHGQLFRGNRFSNVTEMNETIVENWNSVVGPTDQVIHLGDVIFGLPDDYRHVLRRLNGKKTLVLGNHDRHIRSLFPFFDAVVPVLTINDIFPVSLLLSHYPVEKQSFRYTERHFNVHGHTHYRNVDDDSYINVSVEQTGYTPVSIEDFVVKKAVKISKSRQ